MNTLDDPPSLTYNQGNTLPTNFKVIVYVLLVLGVVSLTSTFIYPGLVLIPLALFALTQRQIFEINTEKNFVRDYSLHFGFLKIGKKYPLDKFVSISAMPLVESNKVHANLSQSTMISNSYHAVTIFGKRLKGKRIVTKFDSKSEAQEVAKSLAQRLNMTYFDYDPKLVREVLLGHRTL